MAGIDEQDLTALNGVRPSIARMAENGIVEIAKAGWGKEGIIPLWFGEGDLDSPAVAERAAIEAINAGKTRYAPTRGGPVERQAIADYESRLHGRPIGVDRITITAGGMQGIMFAFQALIDAGDDVVMVHPIWPNAVSATEIMGGSVTSVALRLEGQSWRLDLQELFEACGPRTRAIYVNTPSNPTGWMMSRAEMEEVLAFSRRTGIWILSDEVYGRITYGGQPAPSFLDVAEPEDRVMVFNTHSKSWAMTGWRLGWVTAPGSLGMVFENLTQFSTTGVPTFLHAAAASVMTDGEEQLGKVIDLCKAGRAIVSDALAGIPAVRYAPPDGAFYGFFAVDGMEDSRAFALRLINDANVGMAPGSAFGLGGEGYLRLCFARSADQMTEAMDRLAGSLRRL